MSLDVPRMLACCASQFRDVNGAQVRNLNLTVCHDGFTLVTKLCRDGFTLEFLF